MQDWPTKEKDLYASKWPAKEKGRPKMTWMEIVRLHMKCKLLKDLAGDRLNGENVFSTNKTHVGFYFMSVSSFHLYTYLMLHLS